MKNDSAYQALRLLHHVNPNAIMLYIGEAKQGCTANDLFFDSYGLIFDPKFDIAHDDYEQFLGMHDRLWIGRYLR